MTAKLPGKPGVSRPRATVRVLDAGDPPDPGATLKKSVRAGLIALAIFLGGFIAWSVWAPLSAAVVAEGVVKTDLNRRTVQHQEGGIIKEILVRDGSFVKAGDPLVVLEDVRVDAGVEAGRMQLAADRAKAQRLDAERQLKDQLVFSGELRAVARHPRYAEVFQREQSLFTTRRQNLNSQVSLLEQQIAQVQAESRAVQDQIAAGSAALSSSREELRINQTLERQQFVDKARVLQLGRAVSDYETRLALGAADIARADQKRADLKLRILSLRNDYVQQAAAELKEITSKVLDDEERLKPFEDASRRQVVTAPVTGRVVDIKVNTIGGVVGPRDPLMDLVPDDAPLLIEARLPVDSINELRPDNPAEVRLTAYDHRTTPRIPGKLIYVSADRVVDKTSNQPTPPYYIGHIEVARKALKEAGDLQLRPGMGAEVFVSGRKRTALDYLLDPILRGMQRAMRER